MHTDDRQAVHDLLDVVLDAITEMKQDVNFDLSSHGWSVRVWADNGWLHYENYTSIEPITRDHVDAVKRKFAEIEADTTDASDARSCN